MKRKLRPILCIESMLLGGLSAVGYLIWQNNSVIVSQQKYKNSKVPSQFNDFKIAQISDLHNKEFGKNQIRLVKKIKEESPDIIVITGDFIDRNRTSVPIAMEFVYGVISIAPIYYVPGNHEAASLQYEELKQRMKQVGVSILEDSCVLLRREDEAVTLIGVRDPAAYPSHCKKGTRSKQFKNHVKQFRDNESKYLQILLTHRPEFVSFYANCQFDLVLCGHAHGGQFRFPFIGGLYAPNQGVFPKYTSGCVTIEKNFSKYKIPWYGNLHGKTMKVSYPNKQATTMAVSRGLGNSVFPFRIGNRPELVIITLSNKESKK